MANEIPTSPTPASSNHEWDFTAAIRQIEAEYLLTHSTDELAAKKALQAREFSAAQDAARVANSGGVIPAPEYPGHNGTGQLEGLRAIDPSTNQSHFVGSRSQPPRQVY